MDIIITKKKLRAWSLLPQNGCVVKCTFAFSSHEPDLAYELSVRKNHFKFNYSTMPLLQLFFQFSFTCILNNFCTTIKPTTA